MENSLFQNVYNPDVLSCIANLSNDEVFTPPELANKIIDMLPQELFENPDTTFLDPCCKSGVFLREIAKRLIKGLEQQIPDLEKRIEHIFSKRVYFLVEAFIVVNIRVESFQYISFLKKSLKEI